MILWKWTCSVDSAFCFVSFGCAFPHSVQLSCSVVSVFLRPHGLQHTRPPCLSPTPRALPSNHLILCHPLLPPSILPSIRVFSNNSALHMRWPKYWSFSFCISPSSEHPGLISFRMDWLVRMDWLDLLAVQGTLKGLLKHHSSKASILPCSAFFTVQFSHPYMTTGKTIAMTKRTCIQISQEEDKVVWYSHIFQNFPVYCDPHIQRLWNSQ